MYECSRIHLIFLYFHIRLELYAVYLDMLDVYKIRLLEMLF